jgi:GH43 family beta-xylosidase
LPASCKTATKNKTVPLEYQNPLHDAYFADPFVWRHGDTYYAIGTGASEASGHVDASTQPTVFPLLTSPDLVHWAPAGHAMVRPQGALGDTFWAPEIAHADGRWYLYYSVGFGDKRHQLRVATADAPQGPYVDVAQLTDPDAVPFAIDPHPFRDSDGRWYLFHARDFLEQADDDGRSVRVGTALVVQPLETMTKLAAGPVCTVARARHDWQRFMADRPMYGGIHDWHTLEGPFVVHEGGRYYCLYSGGNWQDLSYGVDYVVADSVLGPYRDEGQAQGPRVLRTVPGHVIGPGHCSVTTAPDGRTRMVVYHAWGADGTARRVCIDPLQVSDEGLRSPGPSWTPQRLPADPAR